MAVKNGNICQYFSSEIFFTDYGHLSPSYSFTILATVELRIKPGLSNRDAPACLVVAL